MGATETKILGKVRRSIGDNDSDSYFYADSEIWLWLRDAVEDVAEDMISVWEPNSITADSDFTVSPAITNEVSKLLTLKTIELIALFEWRKAEKDGLGTKWRGGMDQLDTTELMKQTKAIYLEAKKDYDQALEIVSTNQSMYESKDLFSTSISGAVGVN